MDSAALDLLTPVFEGIDHWSELAPLLPLLVILELILSADNAVALASITKRLPNIELQRRALNLGILIALVLRIFLILAANIIIKYSFFQVLASLYLLSIVFNNYFLQKTETDNIPDNKQTHVPSFIRVTILLSLTDLAFSIDSVTAAVAISDQLLLVITGAIIGVVALRFTADYFLRWLDIYTNLGSAGYIAISIVAIKLLLEVSLDGFDIHIPEYIFYLLILLVIGWGFSKKDHI